MLIFVLYLQPINTELFARTHSTWEAWSGVVDFVAKASRVVIVWKKFHN